MSENMSVSGSSINEDPPPKLRTIFISVYTGNIKLSNDKYVILVLAYNVPISLFEL